MCKLVGYIRVSTNKQAKSGAGEDAQQTSIARYVSESGHELLKIFREVESGKNNNRIELKKALAYCRQTGSRLVIAKLDRLSRSVNFITQLQESNVKFVACDMPSANEVTIQIMAVLAQAERKAISERTQVALAEKKKQGVKLGNPNWEKALASVDVRQANKKSIVVRASKADQFAIETSETIKESGLTGLREIARHLKKNNILTANGKSSNWTPAGVDRVLKRASKISLTSSV